MYETANDSILDDELIKENEKEKERCFRLATVTSLFEDGYYKITFYGESNESEKKYKRLEMSNPSLNDTVLLAHINDNYIILDKISGTVPIAGDGYLSQTQANELFASKQHTHSDYAHIKHIHSSLKPSSESNRILYLDNGALRPSSSGIFNLGTPNYTFGDVYSGDVYANSYHLCYDKIYFAGGENSYYVKMFGSNIFGPSGDGSMNLGSTNRKWNTLYAFNSTISTSDKKEKHDIENLDNRYIKLLSLLKPKRYKFNKGESDRYHTGLIAQDVERALKKCGISSQEFACFIKYKHDNGYGYGLRYEELISILIEDRNRNVKTIDKLVKRDKSNRKLISDMQKTIDEFALRLEEFERRVSGAETL
ncbi:tail fiber domain-containing protein [Lachnoclostridium sp.]|uniref:tail fiber domain-containing protein n=1 Tax=Lachnoclostridium sp. TaxID=2028282 RepID=UPI00289D81A0|nr:tail fiber domain-containing protein [Lachnoclostridium sp.]